jgi:hypothetical protein
MGRTSVWAGPADWSQPFSLDGYTLGMSRHDVQKQLDDMRWGSPEKWQKLHIRGYEVWRPSGGWKLAFAFDSRGSLAGIGGMTLRQERYVIGMDPLVSGLWQNLGWPDHKSKAVWVWNRHGYNRVVRALKGGEIQLLRNESVPL